MRAKILITTADTGSTRRDMSTLAPQPRFDTSWTALPVHAHSLASWPKGPHSTMLSFTTNNSKTLLTVEALPLKTSLPMPTASDYSEAHLRQLARCGANSRSGRLRKP